MYIDIFAAKNVSSFCIAKATHIFFSKMYINVFAIFHDRNFNVMLANNSVVLNNLVQDCIF